MPDPGVDDETWAPVARATREALALLGHVIEPKCLPGESDWDARYELEGACPVGPHTRNPR